MKRMTVHQHEKASERRFLTGSKPHWKRYQWGWLLISTLLLLSILPSFRPAVSQSVPTASLTPQNEMGGRGGIEWRGGVVANTDPPGYYCGPWFLVLAHFHFYVKTDSGPMPVIGVPPDYTKGQSDSKSGILTHMAEDEFADSFPVRNPKKLQDAFRYNYPYTEPRHDTMCASEKNGKEAITHILDQFYGYNRQTGTAGPSVNQTNDNTTPDPVPWITHAIMGFWDQLWRQIVDFFQTQIIDWVNTLGFIWITPAPLSYKNPLVQDGAAWALGALDGYVALLLVIGGYQLLLNRSLLMEERNSILAIALRVAIAAIFANTGFFLFLPAIIELSNSMGMGIMAAMLHASGGSVSLPLGAINWVEQPTSWSIFIIVYFLVAILLIAVEAVRLAVLDLTILLSPLWIMALANEYSRSWGRLGATTFFSALFVQPIQVACLSFGSGLIANFGHYNPNDSAVCQNMAADAQAVCNAHLGHASISSGINATVLLLGLATLYVTLKIPGMFFSSAVRASVGSVNRDITGLARSVMGFMLFQKYLTK